MTNKINILNDKTTEIDVIYHISDVHIKSNVSNDLFEHYINLFDQIEIQLSKETKKFIVVITGDVIDTSYSSECIDVVHLFFNKLVNFCDVIYIKGNHDLINKRNTDGKDMVTSLITNYNTFNLKYKIYSLTEEGLFQYCNILFGLTKMKSPKVLTCKTEKKFIKVGLHHGQVSHEKMDKIIKKQCELNEKDFSKNYDITLLGDCHTMTFLNNSKSVAYAGSLYEVNYRETGIKKGILKWDLKKRKPEFIEIDGIIKHLILNVKNGKLLNYDKNKIPSKAKIKVIYDGDTNYEKLEAIEKKLKSESSKTNNKILEIVLEKDDDNNCLITDITLGNTKKKINEIKTFDIVIKMIIDHIKNNNKYEKKFIDDVNTYLKKISNNVNFNFFEKETLFKLKRLEFENINSYGKNNVINFDLCSNKICEITGNNGTGKSTIITILLLGLYNECDIGVKYDCLNIKNIDEDAKIIIDFEIDSNIYQIKKIFSVKSHSKRECKEDLFLFKNKKEITGRDNVETQKKINELIGSYEKMVDTNIILQRNYKSFSDLTNIEKKKVIFKLSRLDIFDVLAKHVRSELLSLQKKIPMIAKQIKDILDNRDENKISAENEKIKNEIEKLIEEKTSITKKYEEVNKNKIEIEFELKGFNIDDISLDNKNKNVDDLIEKLNSNISELEKVQHMLSQEKFINYDKNKKNFDEDLKLKIEDLIEEKNKCLLQINNIRDDVSEKDIKNLKNEIDKKNKKLVKIDENNKIIEDYENFKELSKTNENLDKQIDKLQNEIIKYKEKQKNINHDIKHDPKCKYCILLKNKITFEENIQLIQKELDECKKEKQKNKKLINKYGDCKEKYNEYIKSLENNKILDNEIKSLQKDLDLSEITFKKNKKLKEINEKNEQKISDIDKNIKKYKNDKYIHSDEYETLKEKEIFLLNVIEKQRKIVDNFEKINKVNKLNQINDDYKNLIKNNNELEKKIKFKNDEIIENNMILKQTKNLSDELDKLKKEKQIVECVNKALEKDGIQDSILVKHILPKLQLEVNNLLTMLSNFRIEIKYLNKTLQVYKVLNKNEKILKLSGYEYMILGLCFRMTFCKLSHQQCNFVCFDEIFTFADDTAIQKIHYLFDYVRKHFDFALVISHNDSIKKYCDVSFDIIKKEGFSRIFIDKPNLKTLHSQNQSTNSTDYLDSEDEKPLKIKKNKNNSSVNNIK